MAEDMRGEYWAQEVAEQSFETTMAILKALQESANRYVLQPDAFHAPDVEMMHACSNALRAIASILTGQS